jgi:hypothetical protein
MKTERRIVFACFTGAALGALVALQLHYFWWVGILVGGVTGYLSYNFGEVITAVVTAWNNLVGGGSWKTSMLHAAQVLGALACILVGAASVLILSIGALMLCMDTPIPSSTWTKHSTAGSDSMPIPPAFWIYAAAGALAMAGVLCVWILRSPNRRQAWMTLLGCLAATPLALPITLGVLFASSLLPRGVRFLLKLARRTFILIHSEVRLLCMTDALAGALVGYLCGNALLGGAVGAGLGWLNYRFICVKWLKLAKA